MDNVPAQNLDQLSFALPEPAAGSEGLAARTRKTLQSQGATHRSRAFTTRPGCLNLEARGGVEPPWEDLQSSA